jgi:6-phosphofructokinase 2
LSAHHLAKLSERFVAASANGIAVLTGSVPPGVDDDIYAQLTRRVREHGGKPVVDTYGALLHKAVPAKPFLIKPNRYELEQFCGATLPTREDAAAQARKLQRAGIDYVCVSLGAEGALLCASDNTYFAKAPAVTVNSTVGAGDSMVAGLVHTFAHGGSPANALQLGIACGTGTTLHPGTELFTANEAELFRQQIDVIALDI